MSPTKKDRESSEVVSSMDASRAVNEPKSVIDMSKFVAILELCLSEKQQEKKSEQRTASRVQILQQRRNSLIAEEERNLFLVSKARKAAYVAFRLISETRGVFHSMEQIKEAI